jgi:hypothetical protein
MNNPRIVNVHFARKSVNLEAALLDHDRNIEAAWIEARQPMTTAEYDAFTACFLADHAWLADRGGLSPSGRTRVVEVSAPNRQTLYVNPEGYGYARYVGIAAE